MNTISFGKANLKDALRISVLLKTVYIETYAFEGVTFESANFIKERFSTEYIEKVILEHPDQLLVAYCNHNPIGIAEIFYETTCPIRKIPVAELSKLYVLGRFNGKGIGYGLMLESEKRVKEKGGDEFNIEVYIENARAISFYERQGYQKIGEIDFPMEENVYKNWGMNKTLK